MNVFKKGSKVLKTCCEDVTEVISPETIADMKKTMAENHGVGLSANQVGICKRFFVANIGTKFGVFINPEIIGNGKEELEQLEGCLSILGKDGKPIYKPKKRWAVITVTYQDEKGQGHKETLKRFDARIFQHEMDHLNGRLCQ